MYIKQMGYLVLLVTSLATSLFVTNNCFAAAAAQDVSPFLKFSHYLMHGHIQQAVQIINDHPGLLNDNHKSEVFYGLLTQLVSFDKTEELDCILNNTTNTIILHQMREMARILENDSILKKIDDHIKKTFPDLATSDTIETIAYQTKENVSPIDAVVHTYIFHTLSTIPVAETKALLEQNPWLISVEITPERIESFLNSITAPIQTTNSLTELITWTTENPGRPLSSFGLAVYNKNLNIVNLLLESTFFRQRNGSCPSATSLSYCT